MAITAGKPPTNPSELLSSERLKTLLTNLTHGPFNWIVIDTPPVLAVTDAVILAPLVNGVTFVIGAEMTRRRLAERALETIMGAHPNFAAVVLNKVDFARLAIVAIQLLPLSSSVRASVSPAAAQVDRALSLGAVEKPDESRRALSLDVTSTRWALAFGASCIGFFWCARSAFARGGVRL